MNPKKRTRKPDGMSRRDFLRATASAVAIASMSSILTGCDDASVEEYSGDVVYAGQGKQVLFNPSDVRESSAEFPLGVSSGEMRPTSVLLWSYTASDEPRRVRLWEDNGDFNKVLLLVDEVITPQDGYLKVQVENLDPYTTYRFTFLEDRPDGSFAGRSLVGRVVTAPDMSMRPPLRIAATTCTDISISREMPALQMMAAEEYDMFCHLGDMSYNDGAFTVGEFRAFWQDILSTEAYRGLMANSGFYISWDDHEVDNNWIAETIEPAKRDNAFQAFYETLPVIRTPDDRLWRSFKWGQTLEVFVLDCRSERIESTRETNEPIYISQAQMDWFKDGLASSPCHFKVVLNSVAMTKMSILWDVAIEDRWSGHEPQRQEVLNHIDDNDIRNVWFLSGDFHVGFVARVEPGSGLLRNETWEIAVGPGQNYNPITLIANPTNQGQYDFIYPPDQFIFGDGTHSATYFTFDPDADTVRIVFEDSMTKQVKFDQTLKQNWP